MKTLAGVMSLVVLLGAACAAELNTPEQLYQKALYLETAKADYQGAIPIYATIISNHEQNAAFTIKALYRQGVCYEKTGQAEQAKQCAQKLADQYADADEVYKVFLKAHFTGQLLPIARLVEKTFGEGSFRLLGNMDTENKSGVLHLESLKKARMRQVKKDGKND